MSTGRRRALMRLAGAPRVMGRMVDLIGGTGRPGLRGELAGHAVQRPSLDAVETAVRIVQHLGREAGHDWMQHDDAIDGWPGGDTLCSIWRLAPPSRAEVLGLAQTWADGAHRLYRLGHGSPGWLADRPADQLDCSAFVSGVLGRRKAGGADWRTADGRDRWLHTGSIVADAEGAHALFGRVADPEPGDLFAWTDRGGRQGHTGIVIAVRPYLEIADCSSSSSRRYGDAIRRRGGEWLRARDGVIWARPTWYGHNKSVV